MKTDSRPKAQGRREINRLDKLDRIREAAREVLASKSYDEATTREIAKLAGVALGTLFLYADDKRDLLFLVVNDDLERIVVNAEEMLSPDNELIDNLIILFRPNYEFSGRNPNLMRLVLRELTFYESGKQVQRYLRTRQRLLGNSARLVREAIASSKIETDEDPDYIGWALFALMQAELRQWLRAAPFDVDRGVIQLRRAMRLILSNMAAPQETRQIAQQASDRVSPGRKSQKARQVARLSDASVGNAREKRAR